MIRPATPADAQALVNIYNHYINDTVITFEETPLTAADFAARIQKVLDGGYPYFVAEEDGRIVGYSYASQFRARVSYRYTVESTVYLDHTITGKGYGTQLYSALIEQLREQGYHLVLGGVTLPNPASQALHEKMGFEKVAHFHEVGFKFKRWLNVGFWELKL